MRERSILDRFYVAFVLAMSVSAVTVAQRAGAQRGPATIDVSVTAYCVSGETRSGTQTRAGIVAADPRVIPLGSRVRVEGLTDGYDGTYTVADTGRAVKGRELDIFIADCAAAKRFGRQDARVRVLKRGPQQKP